MARRFVSLEISDRGRLLFPSLDVIYYENLVLLGVIYRPRKLQPDKVFVADIDECSFLGDLLCDQICTNTEGSFECSCRPGFELYGSKHCVDIDECSEMNDNGGCEQICVNTQGGHYCACEKGYILHRNLFGCLGDNIGI